MFRKYHSIITESLKCGQAVSGDADMKNRSSRKAERLFE